LSLRYVGGTFPSYSLPKPPYRATARNLSDKTSPDWLHFDARCPAPIRGFAIVPLGLASFSDERLWMAELSRLGAIKSPLIEESSARTLELRGQRTKWVHFIKAPMIRDHHFFRSWPELLNCKRDRAIPDPAVVNTNRRLQN